MKKYILILGDVYEADPLTEDFTTEIQTVENVIESNDIHELELMGAEHLAHGGNSYKVLSAEHDHIGVIWTNKAHNQYVQCVKIENLNQTYNLN